MIVIDSSVLVAILEEEPEHLAFLDALATDERRLFNAVNYQETGQVVFARRGSDGLHRLDELIVAFGIEIVAHEEALSRIAVDAFRRYGKGIHSKARLNLGDCAAYALAKATGAPLLFKGDDFAATDIAACVPPPP